MKSRILLVFLAFSLLGFTGCTNQHDSKDNPKPTPFELRVPAGFAMMSIPESNPLTAEKAELGRRLFFEPLLSRDSSISCSSCHKPQLAFADSVPFSDGVIGRKSTRNSPSLMNIGYAPKLMAEGGVATLELQVLAPLEDHNEMDMPVFEACKRLNSNEAYRSLFQSVWNDSVTPFTLTRSLAAFERTLIGGNSRFDLFMQGDSSALSAVEKSGYRLFESNRLGCRNCHAGMLFTNYSIENNGLDSVYQDNGLFRLTMSESDMGKFKVPTLRNIALTAPYMHDGRFSTLEEVIEHYNSGGKNHPNKSAHISGLGLTENEKAALVAFLKALTENQSLED